MDNGESFKEKTLKRLRSKEKPYPSNRKRRISRILVIVDIILIVLLFLYFTSDRSDTFYKTSPLSFGNLDIRFSVIKDRDTGNYLLSLSMASNEQEPATYTFDENIASVKVLADSTPVEKIYLGRGVKSLKFQEGERKSFNAILEKQVLNDFIEQSPGGKYDTRRLIIGTAGDGLPVSINLTINYGDGITTYIDFYHKAEL